MPNIELLNIDCIEYMKNVPDKHFELAIVDPPYGIGYDKNAHKVGGTRHGVACASKKQYKESNWDSSIPSKEYFQELFRISKNQIIWGGNYFTNYLLPTKSWVFWYKHTNGAFSDGELAWTSFDIPLRVFDFMWNGMLQGDMKHKEERFHPTQKPVALYKWLLTKYAKQGDKILDTHGGSMSIAIACHDYGFDLTLCELDKDYYDAGVKRYKNHIKQQKLF